MASEVEWRRKWRPGLDATPWQPMIVKRQKHDVDPHYLFKYCFTQNSYEILVTDLTLFWCERLEEREIKQRIKKLNPGMEGTLTKILDQIQGALEKTQEEKGSTLTVKVKVDNNDESQELLAISVKSQIAGMPFTWNFHCNPAEKSIGSKHLIVPMMGMVGELTRRQQELFKIIQSKDKEIEDYKTQGGKTSRKHIETIPFVETAFEMNMMTSKEFEAQVRNSNLAAFDAGGQDLYRQIMCKRAWVTRSPGKEIEEPDSLAEEFSTQDNSRKRSAPQSWGDSRLPPSLVNKSPTKSQQSASSSKSPRSSSTPEASPKKADESRKRQALESREEKEEPKKQDKGKKKKKLPF